MNRTNLLNHMRFAGYHDDKSKFYRLFVENRVSRAASDEAWIAGKQQKLNGIPCGCHQCQNGAKQA